ncbi:hypothetical protein ANO11243_064840 [Dothideomycetidae sp. 11243]|nr:hypothetical protein ANO11243_064840 [fungal sp. No.11243]
MAPAIPLTIALPAAAASLAYLNARTSFTSDVKGIYNLISMQRRVQAALDADRGNAFYVLEQQAQSAYLANHPYLAIPPPIPQYSYRQVYDQVLKYAAWLKNEHGVKKDDIVAMDIQNCVEYVFVWFALWSLGARPAFINTGLRNEALLHCIRISAANLLVVGDTLVDALSDDVTAALNKDAAKPIRAVVLDNDVKSRIAGMQPHRACDDCRKITDPNNMALLIYTSGTTGLPKAAVISWRRFYSTSTVFGQVLLDKPDFRYFTALPLYHSSAAMLGVGMCLQSGTTIIIAEHFSARTFFPSIIATRANSAQYIGEMCRYLLSTPVTPFDKAHDLRFVFGNGIRPDVWPKFKQRFAIPEICEFYGATESPAGSLIRASNSFGEGAIGRFGALSRLLRRKTFVIVRHDVDTGEPARDPNTGFCIRADTNEPGEMMAWLDPALVKDTYAGYWGNDKATTSKIARNVLAKDDMYFRTGDLIRTDHEGRNYFVDRIGDTFRWKGENVSTGEVEKMVGGHSSIEEVNVYGVQLPGHDGRAGCAAVMFRTEPDQAALVSLTEHVRKTLPKYAAPLFLRTVQAMDTTGTSKYQKQGLRNQGVDPSKCGQDRLFWLNPKAGSYTPFSEKEWQSIVGGQTKL